MVPLWLRAEENMPEFAPDLRLVLNLVSRWAWTAYDGEFAAVASEHGVPLGHRRSAITSRVSCYRNLSG
jgi:hypothetical protein